jgi:hypothetical protein
LIDAPDGRAAEPPAGGPRDLLAPYFTRARRWNPGLSPRTGLRGQVDQILNELSLPVRVNGQEDWEFDSDQGSFVLAFTDDGSHLVILQLIERLTRAPKHHADAMFLLLLLNTDAEGAHFAALRDPDTLVLTARVHHAELTRPRVEAMLVAAFALSRRVDEVMGREPAAPAAAPTPTPAPPPPQPAQAAHPAQPANWYPDPWGQAAMRYWDGGQWTPHTSG